jgi:hypothetical protein
MLLATKWQYSTKFYLMKLILNSLLDALFFPKPNEHLQRNYSDNQYGNGLILIPVPTSPNSKEELISRHNNNR